MAASEPGALRPLGNLVKRGGVWGRRPCKLCISIHRPNFAPSPRQRPLESRTTGLVLERRRKHIFFYGQKQCNRNTDSKIGPGATGNPSGNLRNLPGNSEIRKTSENLPRPQRFLHQNPYCTGPVTCVFKYIVVGQPEILDFGCLGKALETKQKGRGLRPPDF
jgi:hypothetical protein